jgi:hypothetical protein
MLVMARFQISGRGLGVAVDGVTDLPVSRKLEATIVRPDGSSLCADAYKEWLLRRTPEPLETEAFLLMGLTKDDVPVGSELHLEVPSATT